MSRLASSVCTLGLWGCGGAVPLMHPVHTLPQGVTSFAAGSSARFATGSLASAESALASSASGGGAETPAELRRFARGALVRLSVAPRVAPFVAARLGLGEKGEAGLSYTGRSLRLDYRRAFPLGAYAFSVGLGALGVLAHDGQSAEQPLEQARRPRDLELTSAKGYGADLPVLFGYRSDADVVQLWVGVRLGFERSAYDVNLAYPRDATRRSEADAQRLAAGTVLGFAVGLPPFQIAFELDAAYENVSGSLDLQPGSLEAEVNGFTLSPAGALCAKF